MTPEKARRGNSVDSSPLSSPLRYAQGLKSRGTFFGLIAFGVVTTLLVALYLLGIGRNDNLSVCWLYENDSDGSCAQVPVQSQPPFADLSQLTPQELCCVCHLERQLIFRHYTCLYSICRHVADCACLHLCASRLCILCCFAFLASLDVSKVNAAESPFVCMQLLSALTYESACMGTSNGRGMPQRCCALASVLAAKRCHCGFSAPKAAVAKLSGEACQYVTSMCSKWM